MLCFTLPTSGMLSTSRNTVSIIRNFPLEERNYAADANLLIKVTTHTEPMHL